MHNIDYKLILGVEMDPFLIDLGKRIHDTRLKQNMSQMELAEKAQLHPTYISQIEHGKANLSVTVFRRLTEALQVSADWLLQADVPTTNDLLAQEVAVLLFDCSTTERKALLKVLQEMKSSFREISSLQS